MNRHRILQIVVALIALHSITLGVMNWLLSASWVIALKMPIPNIPFWPRQSGALLVSLGLGYGLGVLAPRYLQASALIIILSKFVATVFLFPEFLFRGAPWAVLFAGLGDFSMLIVVGALAWWVYQRPASKGKSEQNT